MEPKIELIWILAIGFGLACGLGALAQRFRLPPVVGYLVAGFLMGPHSPGYVADPYISQQLANIGVTLLMFAVGLNFRLEDLLFLNKLILPGALFLSSLSIALGVLLSLSLGGSAAAGLVIGLAVCVSSTVVIVRVCTDQNLLHTPQGHLAVGWTVAEDLISVFGLIFLPALAYPDLFENGAFPNLLFSIVAAILKMAALILIIYLVGEKLIEKTLKTIARMRSHELFTLAVLAWVFVIAVGSASLFNVSIALGAFIAGTAVGKTVVSHQAAANAIPMRDAFAVLFFVSVGMLFNPVALGNNLPLFLGIFAIVILVRPLIAFLMIIVRHPPQAALTVAFAISQIGEYSYIIAAEGEALHILPENAYDVIVACSFITIALNPMIFQLFRSFLTSRRHYSVLQKEADKEALISGLYASSQRQGFFARVIVIGFGPVGQAAVQFLLEKQCQVVIIDENVDTVSLLKEQGVEAIYGDAAQFRILEMANIDNASLIVISVPDLSIAKKIIRAARHINPHIEIIARSHFSSEINEHQEEVVIISDEQAAAEQMVAAIRSELAS